MIIPGCNSSSEIISRHGHYKLWCLILKNYLKILAVEEQKGAMPFVTAGGRWYNLCKTPILKKKYNVSKKI